MNHNQWTVISAGASFLFIFLSGLWLHRHGKPYNGIVFNIHKLVGLVLGISLILTVYRGHQAVPLNGSEITAIVVTILLFVVTVAAGGLLSVDKEMPAIVSWVHKLVPYLGVIGTAVTLYLLMSRR